MKLKLLQLKLRILHWLARMEYADNGVTEKYNQLRDSIDKCYRKCSKPN